MQKNAFHGSGTLFSRIILQEVRGDGFDIFLGSPSVVYNETDQRIIAKRRKDRSTPPVKTTESMPFFFRNSEMEFFINGTMSGIKAAITDHLEMFFRDVPDKAFDKIHDRNGFLNVLIIFVTIVMERDKITGIRIDPGSGNDRRPRYRPIYLVTVLGSQRLGLA